MPGLCPQCNSPLPPKAQECPVCKPAAPVTAKREGVGSRISYPALGMWAGSAVLFIVSGLMLYSGVRHWSFKRNFAEALRLHDSNHGSMVGSECSDTLRWNPGHHPSRELWGKVLLDSGAPEQAEEKYAALLSAGYRRPSVYAGLGAVYVKKADREPDPARALELIAKAQEYYAQASSIPEGAIGSALCSLFVGVKKNDPSKFKEARAKLEAVLKESPHRAGRDGLLDLYSGLGLAQSIDSPDLAAESFNRASQFQPAWLTPLGNCLIMRAQVMATRPPSGDAYKKSQDDVIEALKELSERTNNKILFGDLVAPLNEYAVAAMILFFRNGDYELGVSASGRLRQDPKDLLPSLVAMSEAWRQGIDLTDKKSRDHVNRTVLPLFQQILSMSELKDAGQRSVALNNQAAYREYLAFTIGSDVNFYKGVLSDLTQAAALDPKNYAAHRNRALLYKRNAIAEKDAKLKADWSSQCAEALKKAEESKTEAFDLDWPKIKEFCEKP